MTETAANSFILGLERCNFTLAKANYQQRVPLTEEAGSLMLGETNRQVRKIILSHLSNMKLVRNFSFG